MSMAGMDHAEMAHGAHAEPDHHDHPMPEAAPRPGHDEPRMQEMEMEAMHGAMEFIVRLLADPAIAARIHADPRLHQLWADPEVQRHLEMMGRMHDAPAHDQGGHHPPAPQPQDHQEHRQPREPAHPH
jgi:hypothetical protein